MKDMVYCLVFYKDGHAELKRKAKVEGDSTILTVADDRKNKMLEFRNFRFEVPALGFTFWVLVEA